MNITVIIPTHNRYNFLKRAISSVQNQTYKPKEIIVVDDGSLDNTSQIQKDFPNITYIYQENRGVSSARNLGIKTAKYEWIAFLDSDDAWHKDKLQFQVDFHKQNIDILMSYTDEKWVRDGVEVKVPKKFRKIGKDAFLENISYCNIAPSATLIHKNLLDKVGVFDESLEVCEDYDLWLRVALEHKIGLIDKKLITKYAGHGDQLSFKHWGMDRFRVVALEKILELSKDEDKQSVIKEELIKKYTLLLKGAIKYDKMPDIKKYEISLKRKYIVRNESGK
jgi:glycosyltransferase involved in cell wall biosynthesis